MNANASTEEAPQLGAPVRLAIIGAGAIADHHLRGFAERADAVSLVAVVDPREGAAARILDRFPNARAFGSIDELIRRDIVDGAIVATPHFMHYEHASQLAGAGIPVLVEKPLVITTAQMRALHEVAERESTIVIAGQTRRFERENVWAKALIDSDPASFGQLRSFDLQSLQNISAYTITAGNKHWLLDGELAGGGVAISLAIHQLDLIRYLSSADFTEVSAYARYEAPFVHGAESQMSAILKMSNGATGTLQASYVADRIPFSEAMTLIGEFGSLVQHAEALGDYRGPLSFASSQGVTATQFSDQLAGWAALSARPELPELHEFSFVNQLVHFSKVIQGLESPMNSIENSFNTIACIEALMISARDGKPARVGTW